MSEKAGGKSGLQHASPIVTQRIGLGLKAEAAAWLEIEQSTLAWGEALRANLVLQGGNAPHRITQPVEAQLGYYLDEDYQLLDEQIVLTEPHTIEPQTTCRYPFRLAVSNAAPLWRAVRLSMGIRSGPWNQGLGLPIQVTPPAACLLIVTQFCQVAAMRVRGWEMRAPGIACARLKGIDKRSLFAEAELELSGGAPGWRGQFTLRSRPGWWWQPGESYLAAPVFAEEPDQIREQILRVLRGAGIRVGDSHDLPLPAGPGALQANDLPIPDERKDPSTY